MRNHRRTYRVDDNGVAYVRVALSGLSYQGWMVLSRFRPPFGRVRPLTPGLRRIDGPEEVCRLVVDTASKPLRELGAEYTISGAHALTQEDTQRRDWRPPYDNGHGGLETRDHTLRLPCDSLELDYRYPRDIVDLSSLRLEVHRRSGDGSWELAHTCLAPEGQDQVLGSCGRLSWLHHAPSRLRLRIGEPRLGYRYALRFTPLDAGQHLDSDLRRLSDLLLHGVRRARAGDEVEQRQRFGFEQVFEAMLARTVGGLRGAGVRWMCLLWNQETLRLEPAFGDYGQEYAGISFGNGLGVAGDAFRHARTSSWHRLKGHSDIYLRDVPGLERPSRHEWVVCVPILAGPDGPAIGVISLEQDRRTEGGNRRLDGLSRWDERLSPAGPTREERLREHRELMQAVYLGFWSAVEGIASLDNPAPRADRDHLRQLVEGVAPVLTPPALANRVFLSHVESEASSLATTVDSALAAQGVAVFRAPESLEVGEDYVERIEAEVARCAVFVLLITPSYRKRRWPMRELALALEHGRPIVPVLVDGRARPPANLRLHAARTREAAEIVALILRGLA